MEISLKDITVTYMKDTPFEKKALDKISLYIPDQSITGIIGHTGSGKSTLIQLIGGLIFPTSGDIRIDDLEWSKKSKKFLELRKQVGVVFQYPEHQLFEETVEKDIAYGPKNFGFSEEEITERVKDSMDKVGLNYEEFANRSPFELSGGQMRRVAIAGVIAFKPKILILDEPTAGLDPFGRREILNMILQLHKSHKMTTIIVTHSMDEVAHLADQIIVLNNGSLQLQGTPIEIFKNHINELQKAGLDIPEITKFILKLNKRVNPPIPLDCFTMDELEAYVLERLPKENKE